MRWAVFSFALLYSVLAIASAVAAPLMKDFTNQAVTAAVEDTVSDVLNAERNAVRESLTNGTEEDPDDTAEAEDATPTMYRMDGGGDAQIKVAFDGGETVVEMALEDFVTGSLLAEMPYDFDTEALRAGAVAVRSCAVWHMVTGYGRWTDGHRGADVCTGTGHCMAYTTEKVLADLYGAEVAAVCYRTIRQAVEDTAGEVLIYDGEVCQTVFHAMSEGVTESSANIWGGYLPYLVSVPAPEDESVPNLYTTVSVSRASAAELLREKGYPVSEQDPVSVILDDADYVFRFQFGEASVSGTEARFLFGLRSARFTVADDGETLTFSVSGYGHGVGLSQYGADCLAKQGKTYKEILSHYYPGSVPARLFPS